MRYTLWSRGRLLGESDLSFAYRENGFRCGWLSPTALGDRFMPVATAVAPAMRNLYILGTDATAWADMRAAVDQEDALALELHGADGVVIATESIGIVDTHYLLSIPAGDPGDEHTVDADDEASIECLLEEWRSTDIDLLGPDLFPEKETELPRYQIQVILVDPATVP